MQSKHTTFRSTSTSRVLGRCLIRGDAENIKPRIKYVCTNNMVPQTNICLLFLWCILVTLATGVDFDPDCGDRIKPKHIVRSSSIPFINNGPFIKITEMPWQVGIYTNLKHSGRFLQHCGGTILSKRSVISAAHCFWNSNELKFYPVDHYEVGAGKTYRARRTSPREMPHTQQIKVMEIRNLTDFRGRQDQYVGDLVILVLKRDIEFAPNKRAICLEEGAASDIDEPPISEMGKVGGWGYETNDNVPSAQLKQLTMPIISRATCANQFGPFLTADKFCGGFLNEQSVCFGDDGGGLVFPKTDANGQQKYYLRGVVTHFEFIGGDSCENPMYSLFTNVAIYQPQIHGVLGELKTKFDLDQVPNI